MKKSICLLVSMFFLLVACDDSGSTKVTVTCGDGKLDPGEACDGADLGAATCESLGWRQGQLACTATCDLDLADCASWGRCGDGVVQDAIEQCDRLQLGGTTCESLGFSGGELTCADGCLFDTSGCEDTGVCGDGELFVANEDCESLLPVTATCGEFGYWNGTVGCDAHCTFDTADCNGVQEIALGNNAVFTIDSRGQAWGWGWSDGGLGQPVLQHYATPMSISLPGGLLFRDIATFELHSCVTDSNRNAWCWGANGSGQLGNATTTNSLEPVPVRMPVSVYFDSVTVGYDHSCGLGNNGVAYCWGANGSGQLGNGTTTSASQPTMAQMPAGVTFTRLEAGFQFNCAIGSDGRVYCWGAGSMGRLGNGGTDNLTAPAPITLAGVSFSDLDCGFTSTCAVTTTGAAYCWGRNDSYQLGLGDTTNRPLPALRSEPTGVAWSKVAMGASHGCTVSTTGRLWCWGFNNAGQVGNGTTDMVASPVEISLPSDRLVLGLATGNASTCVRLEPGLLACWGLNDHAQFGFPAAPVPTPVLVPGA